MLSRLNNYDDLYRTFKWNIPEYYNIASDTVDREEYQKRTALINILGNGKVENWSFKDIKVSANKLANVFDYFKLKMQLTTGQLPTHRKIRESRKSIALIKTIINEKRLDDGTN